MGDGVVLRARHLHDPVVLRVQREVAAHAAVGADRVGGRLARLVPVARRPASSTRCGASAPRSGTRRCSCRSRRTRSRAGRRRARWRCGRRTPPGHGDGERVLPLLAAGVDALVAEDALGVVADVELVVVLDRLLHGGGVVAEAGSARRRRPRSSAAAARCGGQVDRGGEQLQHQPAGAVDPLGRRSGRPCRPRPSASRSARGRASPPAPRRRPGRRWPARSSGRSRAWASRRRPHGRPPGASRLRRPRPRAAVDGQPSGAADRRRRPRGGHSRRPVGLQLGQRGADGTRRGLAEAADRRVRHHRVEVGKEGQLAAACRRRAGQAGERLDLALRPHAARHALPAALEAEEGRDALEHGPEVDGVVEDDEDARAEAGARRPQRPRT